MHRVPGGGRANDAYEGELAEWLRSNDAQEETEREESTPVEPDKAASESGVADGGGPPEVREWALL